MKQYVVKEAYVDNYYILQYVDGKLEDYTIVSYYELDGYVAALQNMGYKKAYYLPEYSMKMREAQKKLNLATKAYEEAMKNPLALSNEEVEQFKRITHIEL